MRWMEAKRLPVDGLDELRVDQSLGSRRCAGDRRKAVLQVLDYLREEGLAQPRRPPDDGSAVWLLERRSGRRLQGALRPADETGVTSRPPEVCLPLQVIGRVRPD